MQRVRMVLPYLKQDGLNVTVLASDPSIVRAPHDPWLCEGMPNEVSIIRAPGLSTKWCSLPGFGTLSARAFRGLRLAGDNILASDNFDLVYFSTTQFGVHRLGPYWKKKHDVPFVMDYQDPWVNDYYRDHPEVVPPGGRLKYGFAHQVAKWTEPRVLRHCSGITSVSPAYPSQLRQRYPFFRDEEQYPELVAPFPGDAADIQRVQVDPRIKQSIFDPNDGFFHWVYIGRGGEDMRIASIAFFKALQTFRERSPDVGGRIRVHLIGTSYAAKDSGQKSLSPLAEKLGVSDLVSELPNRIPYSETIRCILDAQAILAFGSNDAAYTASKIYPYLLARKPLLMIFHQLSSVVKLAEQVGGGVITTFRENQDTDVLATRILEQWFLNGAYRRLVALDDAAFAPFTAKSQSERLCEFFTRCVSQQAR